MASYILYYNSEAVNPEQKELPKKKSYFNSFIKNLAM